jgi:hypothetical protein
MFDKNSTSAIEIFSRVFVNFDKIVTIVQVIFFNRKTLSDFRC